jgi:hypothetical protein
VCVYVVGGAGQREGWRVKQGSDFMLGQVTLLRIVIFIFELFRSTSRVLD